MPIALKQTRFVSSWEMSPKWLRNRRRGSTRRCWRRAEWKTSLRYFVICTAELVWFLSAVANLTHTFSLHLCQIIPYNALKKEYKPYEAKRRLLNNFDVFISDDRIRRLLPSHLGKHFYERKKWGLQLRALKVVAYLSWIWHWCCCICDKVTNPDLTLVFPWTFLHWIFSFYNSFSGFVSRIPLCVNMKSKNVAKEIQKVVQGSNLKVNNKGSCWWDQCYVLKGICNMFEDIVITKGIFPPV